MEENMRVYMKKNITAYSGKDQEEDVVYRSLNNGNYCIAAEFTAPKEHPQFEVFRANIAVLKDLWNGASGAFKTELKSYTDKLNADRAYKNLLRVSGYCLFVKMIYAYVKAEALQISGLDLVQLRTSNVKSLKSAVDSGYLPKVEGYDAYTAII
jgi:hypothetical protein